MRRPTLTRSAAVVLHSCLFIAAAAPLASRADAQASSTLGEKAPTPAEDHLQSALAAAPVGFVENLGQWTDPSLFRARQPGVGVSLERDRIRLALCTQAEGAKSAATVEFAFAGASCDAQLVGETELPVLRSFFLGSDPAHWASSVRSFEEVVYRGLYPGVEVRVHTREGELEYDLELAPGASLSQVALDCANVDSLELDGDGALVLHTPAGALRQRAPKTFEVLADRSRREVECRFRITGPRTFGFESPSWSGENGLVVDPAFLWSTYLGGTCHEYVHAVAIEPVSGDVFVAGQTASFNFPLSAMPFDSSCGCSCPLMGPFVYDGFLARLDPSGTILLYATYFGGTTTSTGTTASDSINALAISNGLAVFAGSTDAVDFPVSPSAFQTTYQGGAHDGFVAKMHLGSPAGFSFSTYLGGTDDDAVYSLVMDTSTSPEEALVAGATKSSNFPTTPGAFDTTFNGNYDAFVSHLGGMGNTLVRSTYLGGSGDEAHGVGIPYGGDDGPMGLARDFAGGIYVGSITRSTNFPVTFNAYDTTPNGGFDAFATKFDSTLSVRQWSTYFGGWSDDQCLDLVEDGAGGVWFCGTTQSDQVTTPVFPLVNAYSTTFGCTPLLGCSEGWFAHLVPGVPRLVLQYSSYIGGSCMDSMQAIRIDPFGKIVLGGWTTSMNFPVVGGTGGFASCGTTVGFDGTLARFDTALIGAAQLLYSTYFGGTSADVIADLRLNSTLGGLRMVVGGNTISSNFPVGPGFSTTYGGGVDGFVTQF